MRPLAAASSESLPLGVEEAGEVKELGEWDSAEAGEALALGESGHAKLEFELSFKILLRSMLESDDGDDDDACKERGILAIKVKKRPGKVGI